MALTAEEVRKLARLSRLHLDEDEVDRLRSDLDQIVGYVEHLREVDTDGVEPMVHAVPTRMRRRPDEAAAAAGRAALRGSAGFDEHEGLVRVPRIVE